jgi:hypothetical protein
MPLIQDRTITIATATAGDQIWNALLQQLGRQDDDLELRQAFFAACARVDTEADGVLRLPGHADTTGPHFLDRVNEVLRDYTREYESALERSGGRPGAEGYNDLLRISYNFASEASDLIRLILQLGDLKPLVSWGTLGAQYRLALALSQLTSGDDGHSEKPSIAKYRETITETRNSAFHHLLPFHRSLVVPLSNGDLQRPQLRLFAEYRNRKQNQLIYEDKELVDVLVNFTHAAERVVPPGFWRSNREVMHASIELFDTCAKVLTTVYRSLPPQAPTTA